MARLVLAGAWNRPGVHPPEVIGREQKIYNAVLKALRERSIMCDEKIEQVGGSGLSSPR